MSTKPQTWAAEWLNTGLEKASLNVPELERLSSIPRVTIYNILNCEAKNGCRVDLLYLLVNCCGLHLPDPPR